MQVRKIVCARVYHINVVLRIRTSVQDTGKDQAYKEKSLQIQRSAPRSCITQTLCMTLVACHCVSTELLTTAQHA